MLSKIYCTQMAHLNFVSGVETRTKDIPPSRNQLDMYPMASASLGTNLCIPAQGRMRSEIHEATENRTGRKTLALSRLTVLVNEGTSITGDCQTRRENTHDCKNEITLGPTGPVLNSVGTCTTTYVCACFCTRRGLKIPRRLPCDKLLSNMTNVEGEAFASNFAPKMHPTNQL